MSLLEYLERERPAPEEELLREYDPDDLQEEMEEARSAIDRAFNVAVPTEELGREIAADRDVNACDDELWTKMFDWKRGIGKTGEHLKDFKDTALGDQLPDWALDMVEAAWEAARRVKDDAKTCCEAAPYAGEEVPLYACHVSPEAEEAIRRLDEIYERAKGKRCTWLLGNKKPYNVTSAVNDVTSCFHRAVEEIQKLHRRIVGGYERVGNCTISKDAHPVLREFCEAYGDYTEEYDWLYYDDDKGRQKGFVVGKKGEFRVGDTSGHLTHIDLTKGKLEYNDWKKEREKVIKVLFEAYAGLKCEHDKYAHRVTCTGLHAGNAEKAAKVLAVAPSMDIRFDYPEDYWSEEDVEACSNEIGEWKKFAKKYGVELDGDGALELCLLGRNIFHLGPEG